MMNTIWYDHLLYHDEYHGIYHNYSGTYDSFTMMNIMVRSFYHDEYNGIYHDYTSTY